MSGPKGDEQSNGENENDCGNENDCAAVVTLGSVFVILSEVKDPRSGAIQTLGFFAALRMTDGDEGVAAPRKARRATIRRKSKRTRKSKISDVSCIADRACQSSPDFSCQSFSVSAFRLRLIPHLASRIPDHACRSAPAFSFSSQPFDFPRAGRPEGITSKITITSRIAGRGGSWLSTLIPQLSSLN
jgi:hypothetical protein